MRADPSQPEMPATLREIVEHKRDELAAARSRVPLAELRSRAADAQPPRGFFEALTGPIAPDRTRVIAEVKRRSPSAGLIRPEYEGGGFDPEFIARQYSEAGASAISCLTDEKFFGGCLDFIRRVKAATTLPVLRKDFIIDPYQIVEARAHDADAVLLIAECLPDDQIRDMLALACELGLSVLLEVHSKANLLRVQPIMSESTHARILLGINNRDLTRMVTDLSHTTDLIGLVDDPSILVSESGIRTRGDLARLRASGVHSVLLGEHLMRQPHPGSALRELLAAPGAANDPQ